MSSTRQAWGRSESFPGAVCKLVAPARPVTDCGRCPSQAGEAAVVCPPLGVGGSYGAQAQRCAARLTLWAGAGGWGGWGEGGGPQAVLVAILGGNPVP